MCQHRWKKVNENNFTCVKCLTKKCVEKETERIVYVTPEGRIRFHQLKEKNIPKPTESEIYIEAHKQEDEQAKQIG